MRLQRFASSWRIQLLAALALVHDAGCGARSRTDVKCGSEAVLLAGKPTGLESCSDNVVHRAEIVACADPFPRDVPACVSTSGTDECHTDADCTSSPLGICGSHPENGFCSCSYGCLTDDDCDFGRVCVCGDPIGTCEIAACKSDMDCKKSVCTAEFSPAGGTAGFACQSPEDECEIDADCDSGACFFDDALNTRICAGGGGGGCFGSGRPFLVEGAARTAEVAEREDWLTADPRVCVSEIPAREREAIAAGWARAGLLEHASIAAFARFTLQLLSLGAPPDLIRDAQAAMADETEHTRLCFALASSFGGAAIGPGPLSLAGALEGGSPREILETAILEGCIGETVAALEAQEMAQRAADPAVRRVLEIIAADEARHAELGWRFVKWAIGSDPSLAAVAGAAFAAASERLAIMESSGPDLSAHGLASAPLRREIARCALAEVVSPCAAALLRDSHSRGVNRISSQPPGSDGPVRRLKGLAVPP